MGRAYLWQLAMWNKNDYTVDSHLPVRWPTNAVRSSLRSIFSARIRSHSKPYQRRSLMRSDRHYGLRSIFCGKTANSIWSLRSNRYFQYIVMIILAGYFYIEKLSHMFSTHVQCVRELLKGHLQKIYVKLKYLIGARQIIWLEPNNHLAQTKSFGLNQIIIWREPNHLAWTR